MQKCKKKKKKKKKKQLQYSDVRVDTPSWI